ncbi:MAG: protein kinase domain-containing protein, partial [Kofleriaceae bacterium]
MSDHERLTELFGEAIELDPTARAQLIARVRASDAALAAELVALLDADAAAPPALRTGGLLPTELDTVRDRPQRTGPPVRLSIPGYRIEGLLGEGGMGAVYAGEQESPQRRVAIKVLHVATGPALARFWTEAAIMARLDHPGIARVLESGESGGHPFIVMERVEGMTLDDHVAETRPPLHQRLELFAAVCDAVHHAHLNGVIHRDLKPSNVMVRGDGRIAVLDFGIARTATLDGSSSGETRAGELIGTPLYMSPEQARLRPDEVDARSDVYSLGVTLYVLVAGDLPYPVRDLPLPALSLMICEEPPRSLRALGFERDLDAIAGKALAKDPRDRYQSAAALADDLRRYLEGRTVSVRTPGTLEQLRRFARRRPASAAAIAGGVAIALVFAIVVTRLWLAAVQAEHAAGEARARAEAARDALAARTADLTLQQARAVVARDPTRALALLDELRGSGLVGGAEVSPWAIEVIATEARGRGVASHVLRGHHDEVHWVEQVPGDRGVLTASYDGTVQLWQAPFAASRTIFRAARGRIHTARPSPDGARFAIGGDDGALHVVDPAGTHALAGHTVDVELVVWSQDGAWLVTGDDSGAVFAWPRGAAPGRRLEGPAEAIESLAFSIDGGAVIAGEREVGGRPLALPMVDVHTVGAGGGSIAWLDAGGALR